MTLISHKKISQDVRVLIYEYPFAEREMENFIKLFLIIQLPGDRNPNIGQVHMTDWTSFKQFELIGNWAKTIVDSFAGKLHPIDVKTSLPPTNCKQLMFGDNGMKWGDFQSSHSLAKKPLVILLLCKYAQGIFSNDL